MQRIPESKCLGCGAKLDAYSSPKTSAMAKEGDISICLDCGHVAVFGKDLRLRPLTDEEIIDIASNDELLALQMAWAKANGMETN